MASTKSDLLKTAEVLAAGAISCVGSDWAGAAKMAAAAKMVLEAAALAENTSGGQIDEALGSIQGLLEDAGVLAESMELPTAEFLTQTFRALLAWRGEAMAAQGYEVAYDTLRELAEGLERDWIAADTEVSRRLAARVRTRLDEAAGIVNHGKQQGRADGHEEN